LSGSTSDQLLVSVLFPNKNQNKDERDKLVTSHEIFNNKKLQIVDCRSKWAARGNLFGKVGNEDESNYKNCNVQFMDIGNVDKIRSSYQSIQKLSEEIDIPDRLVFEHTNWLNYIKKLLESANNIAKMIEDGNSVLVHCSDGTDRTSQVVSTVQLLLDPFYRTIKGFGILIQKEWLSFSHSFEEKCGIGLREDSQEVPIFLQWIDAVYQLLVQFGNYFEFNEAYLIELLDNLYSCRFGTFLGNSEKERKEKLINDKTLSLWPYLSDPKLHSRFSNPEFVPYSGRLSVVCSTSVFEVWLNYYQRYKHSLKELQSRKKKVFKTSQELTNELNEKSKHERMIRRYIASNEELKKTIQEEIQKAQNNGVPLEQLEFLIIKDGDKWSLKLKESISEKEKVPNTNEQQENNIFENLIQENYIPEKLDMDNNLPLSQFPILKISQSDDDDFDYMSPSITPLQVLGGYYESITVNIFNLLKWLKPF